MKSPLGRSFCRLVALVLAATSSLAAQGAGPGAPTITITPGSGGFALGQVVQVTVEFCDDNGLNTESSIIQFNGITQNWPKNYVIGNPGSCLARLTQTGSVTLAGGTNTLRASIEDTSPAPLWSKWQAVQYITPEPWRGLSIVAANQYLDASPLSYGTQRYIVTNLGLSAATVSVTATNAGLASLDSLKSPADKRGVWSLAAGASGEVTVRTRTPATAGASGRAIISVSATGTSASAWTEVRAVTPATLVNGVTLVNPTGILEKSLCLTIAAGPGAAVECGELRLAYALPGVATKNKGRAPTLIYSAQSAQPTVALPADLTLTDPAAAGATFTARVWMLGGPLTGQSFDAGAWQTADFGGVAGTRRILATFDGSVVPTGRHPIRLDISMTGGATYQAFGELLMVNRAASPFNAGWWLAGLEQLVPYSESPTARDTVMWVGGDGSARVYRETGEASCIYLHEALDRPDSLVGTFNGSSCVNRERRTSNGLRVIFDASGNHIQTINRLAEVTSFTHSSGRLTSIDLPSGSLARQYSFVYTGAGALDSIIAPGLPGFGRAVKVTTSLGAPVGGAARHRTLSLRSPDTSYVHFGYQGGSTSGIGGHRVVTRTDRMGVVTTFGYDGANRLASASTPASLSQTVTSQYRVAESQGRGTGAAGQAVPIDSVYTMLDGPRADVADVSKWWLNRLGAPVRSRNPVGAESRIAYDAAFPALPAVVSDAAGLTTSATYVPSRGLVATSTVVAPYGGANAVTTVQWDTKWDLPLSSTDPNGIVTKSRYDGTTGNLLRTWVGADSSRRTRYEYDPATNQLARIYTPTLAQPDEVFYDTYLGNVTKTKTPGGKVTTMLKDAVGRDTLVVTSADVATDTVTKLQRQRIAYDAAGRVRETAVSATEMPYTLTSQSTLTEMTPVQAETLFTRTTYDREGRPLTINTFSRPNFNTWEQCGDPVGKCRGVPMGTEGSFDIRTYDWIGRSLTQRLGSGPIDVQYDPAGNVVSEFTRNGATITSKYDAANRLVQRIVPTTTHAMELCGEYAYGMLNSYVNGQATCFMKFPMYPTPGGSSLVLSADTLRFVFDQAGRMVRADNKDALVSRTYHPAGSVSGETTTMRSYSSPAFNTSFSQSYTYDVGGRRTSHTMPYDGSITYAYEADRGYLRQVLNGANRVDFFLDDAGRQDSLAIFKNGTQGIAESRDYLPDGELQFLRRRRFTGTAWAYLLENTMTYDARGKIRSASVNSASMDVEQQEVRNRYSGLGAVVASEKWRTLRPGEYEIEQFRTTAMGEVWKGRSHVGSQYVKQPVLSRFDVNGALRYKYALIGPGPDSASMAAYYTDTTYSAYDNAGNAIRSGAVFQYSAVGNAARYYTATRTYYSADNRVAVVQRYHATDAGRTGSWEEYRYDALGRRILTRSRRGNTNDVWTVLCGGQGIDCTAFVERVIWDGDQVLFELRNDGGDNASTYTLDSPIGTGPQWGKVGYVHAGGIDKPIMTTGGLVPTYNWRGLPESAVWSDGAQADCSLPNPPANCLQVTWPSQNSIYMKTYPYAVGSSLPPVWVGTVLADGAGSTGMLYRRNRFYDPTTGQFTQQDPIGIAGGANVYGFAGGDPVNYADPFGLCPGINGTLSILDCPPGYLTLIGEMTGALIGGVAGGTGGASAGAALCAATVVGTVPCAAAGGAAGAAAGAKRGAIIGGAVGALLDGAVAMASAGKGRGGNQNPNADANRAARDAGLNRAGQRALHDEITGQDLTVEEIREIANRLAEQAKYLRNPPK